ncbi:ParA family protein [Candidatus Halobonum tyrrellensis]|uniref:Cobq/cobb/mind/para nucleotide binding domain-containing protein n=1 Tax=Candidatus Halobonum tyrrellensis G22 TaxID=1324957 RepID=V4HJW8_9EURY|nr:AAA family ATPase [Candidatus Halobonum tyrrellensis]ESP88214.1 cobq/cobb/mind/para nucleotide binding domain-containing protein [Candidatus Halobonum tyrrellensis G22]
MTQTPARTVALVGTAGGVGTTRTAVECAAALARAGRDVAVVDAAYGTQGLARFVDGRVEPDATALCLAPERPLAEGLSDLGVDTEGRVALAPAHAPFERLAGAKTPDAAQAFERRLAEAADAFDHVLVDTPPVAANQAVAAVTAADRVALVASADARGADTRRRMADRLADVGAPADLTVSVGGDLDAAEATVPDLSDHESHADNPDRADGAGAAPAALGSDDAAAGVVAAAGAVVDDELDVDLSTGGVLGRLRRS